MLAGDSDMAHFRPSLASDDQTIHPMRSVDRPSAIEKLFLPKYSPHRQFEPENIHRIS
jgi:hypothetical protein